MTLYEFNALSADEQTAFAMAGNFVDVRMEEGLKVALYSHPEFYAEVYYDGQSNKVIRCRAFKSASQLAAYIKLN
jgi:hypothetical protein